MNRKKTWRWVCLSWELGWEPALVGPHTIEFFGGFMIKPEEAEAIGPEMLPPSNEHLDALCGIEFDEN